MEEYNRINFDGVKDGNSHNENNDILGTAGDDWIIAGASEPKIELVEIGKDKFQERDVNDNDVVEAGLGDDVIFGGYGNDEFVFNFSITTQKIDYDFRSWGDLPAQQANLNAWNSEYQEWKAWLATQGDVDWGNADSWSEDVNWIGKKGFTQKFEADDVTASVTKTVVTGDGHDTIMDFGNGNDTLVLKGLAGLTEEQFVSIFDVSLNDSGATVLSWGGGSITINGLDISSDKDFFKAAVTNEWFVA